MHLRLLFQKNLLMKILNEYHNKKSNYPLKT